jgi:hypothetical protein
MDSVWDKGVILKFERYAKLKRGADAWLHSAFQLDEN